MKNKKLKNMFLQETAKIDISMSEKLKNTQIQTIQTPKQEIQDVQEIKIKKTFNWKNMFVPITAVACAVIIILSFFIPTTSTSSGGTSYLTAYILEIDQSTTIDSNSEETENISPSIAIVTDDNDNIINIFSVNEDADEILNSNEFSDITNMKLSEAIEKVVKITSHEGYFNGNNDTIKIYALNDNKNKIDNKLDRFGEFIKTDLKEFGHENINFEKLPMQFDFFRDIMGFDRDFDRLDDMRNDIKMHDRLKGEFPPPPPPEKQ